MKKLISSLLKPCNSILSFFLFLIFPFAGFAENPFLSNHLVNLSAVVNTEALDDVRPEMIIEGNIVHTAWIEYKYGTEQWLYYRRSTDLGKTWEAPKPVLRIIQWERENPVFPGSNFLAVDGNNVHIAIDDYIYAETKRLISYIRSADAGATFGTPQELEVVTGNYDSYRGSCIKAANGKVAIVYGGAAVDPGIFLLFSGNGGNSFVKKTVSKDYIYLSDFFYDGSQMIVLGDIRDIYLSYGRVYASVSNNDGEAFTTSKISRSHKDAGQNDVEQCITHHHYRNSKKIAKSGNSIHIVFSGIENGAWTTFYARSVNNGGTFEGARDINQGVLPSALLQNFMETVAAKNGRIYIAYGSKQVKPYFLASDDNGTTFSEPRMILSDKFSHIENTTWPNFALDPADSSGKTFYITGSNFFSIKSADGGLTFFNSSFSAPFLLGDFSNGHSRMVVDNSGNKHWISEARFRKGTDKDIFYRIIGPQPEPGSTNKSCLIETISNDKAEVLIVPSTPELNFGPAMTAEAWVKIDPSTENKINILGKINGYDGDNIYPFFEEVSGYFMGFLKSGNKFALHTRLVTDKGKFLNIGDYTVDDNLWHHIAITYNAGAGTNNFKTYFDGLLVKEQTVTGDIVQGDGLLMIGSRSNYYHTSKYEVDDIRLWNRALSQEELLFNQVNKLNGKEEGLKLFLNFDDTFKDLSGNGHDALPVYQGILKNSDFDPPVPGFEMFRIASEVTFNNKTTNATEYTWNFGDGQFTGEANPKHTYSRPGEYSILLKAGNNNSITAAKGNMSIAGIDRIEPATAGNLGRTTIRVYGGGLPASPVLKLVKNGTEIAADTVITIHPGEIHGTFNLTEQPTGKWDVVVVTPSGNMELKESLTVEEVNFQNPYVNVSGRSTVLANIWHTQIIEIGNPGNIDLKNVPLFIAISNLPGIEYEFINFEVVMQKRAIENGLEYLKDSVPIHFIQENFFPEIPGQATVRDAIIIPLVIGNLPAQTTFPLQIRLKSEGPFDLQAWTYGVVNSGILKSAAGDQTDCLKDAVMVGVTKLWWDAFGMAVTSLPMGCVKSVYGLYEMVSYSMEGKEYTLTSFTWDVTSIILDCAGDLIPVGKAIKITVQAIGMGMDAAGLLKNLYDCLYPNSQIFKRIFTVFSFDPNEMVGPAGFGDQNWIQKSKTIPYTIFFENKSEATAPAHMVTISDTLDLNVFDISEFGFGPFGWGDTIFSPPGIKMKQFSMDIDLRPELELITRVSGKLDTLTGIVRWEFLSLNPGKMDLEEDPFLGFLPPNVTSPEGEGFVSFSVGLKEELGTGDEIRNKASIVFDANEPIITNEYLNTLDLDAPQSQVYPLEATIDSRFQLDWTGNDEGSGIKGYTVFVMVNDTALVPWMINTTETSAMYEGEVGSSYKFYSIATDNVNLVENAPNGYDAQTTVTVNMEEFERMKTGLSVWPNPAADNLRITLQNAPCGMYAVELVSATGAVKHSQLYTDLELHNGISLNVNNCTPGNYIARIIFGNKTETRNIIIH